MPSYTHLQQTWDDALATLGDWIPGFCGVTRPDQLGFDTVAGIMEAVPQGFQTVSPTLLDADAVFIDAALDRCRELPSEVIVIPDCGSVSRLPLRLPVSELVKFVGDFDHVSGSHCIGLLDGATDIFFGFDTGDMLLVDHDERVWFSPSSTLGHSRPMHSRFTNHQGEQDSQSNGR